MNDKMLYKQKLHPQLDEGIADIAKLKVKTSGTKTATNDAMHKQVAALKCSLKDPPGKRSQCIKASSATWDLVKKAVESVWDSLKFAASNTPWRFKD